MELTSNPSHTTLAIQQNSPLLRLPAELKNYIYELVMPTKDSIALRANYVRLTDDDSSPRFCYRFAPATPPLLAVCREIRNDAIALYYGSNTLLVTDIMLQQTKALDAFTRARTAALQHVRKVRVVRTSAILYIMGISAEKTTHRSRAAEIISKQTRISFLATERKGGIELTDLKTKGPPPKYYYDEAAAGVCCCTLEGLARNWGSGKAGGGGPENEGGAGAPREAQNPTLLGMLVEYARLMEEYERQAAVRREKGEEHGPNAGAKGCLKCRKVKTI